MYRCGQLLVDEPEIETVEDEVWASLGEAADEYMSRRPPSAPIAPGNGALPQIPLSPLGPDGLPAGLGMMPVGG